MITVGTRVDYRGSIDDLWGRYRVSAVDPDAVDGPRYELADHEGNTIVHKVRHQSVRVIPDGPKHHVLALAERATVIERMAMDKHGGHVPTYIAEALRLLPGVIDRNRPAEAESYLLSLEVSVGAISQDEFQRSVPAIVVAGDDDSWSRDWTLAELDGLRRDAGLPPRPR